MIAGAIIFLAPLQQSLTAVFWLVLVDAVFGIVASKKRGEKIESRKLFNTPLKYAVYFGTIVAVHQAEPMIAALAVVSATKIVVGIVAATELLSLLEKASVITGAPLFEKLRDIMKPPKGNV